jgi:uncharacterized protein (UPF0276 family)
MTGTGSLKVGVNWTKAAHAPLMSELMRSGRADYCEILIDNFLHTPAHELAEVLGGAPVAFHIMHSRFLERSEEQLVHIAKRIREMARELRPLYISDHLLRFTSGGRELVVLPELDYERVYDHVRERVTWWQNALDVQVCFENYPSILDSGLKQPAFFEALLADTKAGLLFDLSNSICAQRNCGVDPAAWDGLLRNTTHFHTAGYELSANPPHIAVDTHGQPLAEDTLALIRRVTRQLPQPMTICVERDEKVELELWSHDLFAVREMRRNPHA